MKNVIKLSKLLLIVVAMTGLTFVVTTNFVSADNANSRITDNINIDEFAFDKCGGDSGETTEATKCSGEDKSHKEDCEGKCGEDKSAEAKCGDGKSDEAKCGEGKCGGDNTKVMDNVQEAKCGDGTSDEAKCGEGKCG